MQRRASLPPLALAAAAWVLLVVARVLTLAPDAWEWDEVLFVRAVRLGPDLRAGRPHAPGYPLFVEAARAVSALGVTPFRSTVLTGFAGGVLAPVGLAALLAALELPLAACALGGALYAFVPAVWLHGGRPLSDAPAAAAFLFASAALVRAVQKDDPRWLAAGAALAALAFGIRPQTAVALLPLAGVAAFGFLRRGRFRPVVAALGLGLALSALAYVPVIRGSGGWKPFRDKVVAQAVYVRDTDSLTRADLTKVETWTRWFRDPFGLDALAIAFGLLALLAFALSFRKALLLLALFLPLIVLTIPYSSLQAAPRYAVVLLPLAAALGAAALERLRDFARVPAVLLGAGLVGACAFAATPAILEVTGHASPPVAAFRALETDPALAGRPLVIWTGLAMHHADLLSGTRARQLGEDKTTAVTRGELIVMSDDAIFGQSPIRHFAFANPLLLRISRARYLNVSIVEGDPGLGVLRPWLDGQGEIDWATGDAKLVAGDLFTVRGVAGPVNVAVTAEAGDQAEARIRVTTNGPSRRFALTSRERGALAFQASPGADGVLFRLRVEEGNARLTDFHFEPAAGGTP
ncbi:MAG: hypothetical protein ABI584_01190 [Acidobacteriota bacterium]